MVLALEKENAVEAWRNTIGSTNPKEARKKHIRKDFATNVQENAVHGSDSNENAQKEIAFFFLDSELRVIEKCYSCVLLFSFFIILLIFSCSGNGLEGFVNEPITITALDPDESQDYDYFWSVENQPDGSLNRVS